MIRPLLLVTRSASLIALFLLTLGCQQFSRVGNTNRGNGSAQKPHRGGQGGSSSSGSGTNTASGEPVTGLTLKLSAPPFGTNRYAFGIPYSNSPMASFDIFLPKGPAPAPLVIFIHGGGFQHGDKKALYKPYENEAMTWMAHGFGVATVSYRYLTDGPNGVMNSLDDMRRCIQFIRYHAQELGIDKDNIGCFGGSAGAGGSLWLAMHDDMANPQSNDPVERESTRIQAVALFNPQSTYDMLRWDDIFGKAYGIKPSDFPGAPEGMMMMYAAPSMASLTTDPKFIALRHDLDMLSMFDPSDPPIWVSNDKPNTAPKRSAETLHHPLHVQMLVDAANANGVSIIAKAPSIGMVPADPVNLVDFFERNLK